MKNLCAMFEISVEDFNRAKEFYESILEIEITGSKKGTSLNNQITCKPGSALVSRWGRPYKEHGDIL